MFFPEDLQYSPAASEAEIISLGWPPPGVKYESLKSKYLIERAFANAAISMDVLFVVPIILDVGLSVTFGATFS